MNEQTKEISIQDKQRYDLVREIRKIIDENVSYGEHEINGLAQINVAQGIEWEIEELLRGYSVARQEEPQLRFKALGELEQLIKDSDITFNDLTEIANRLCGPVVSGEPQ